MAALDIAGYVAAIKEHAVDHRFHVHDERHFIETYSMRQTFEVDLHPENACGEPLDLHLALEVDPRVALDFDDHVAGLPEGEKPEDRFQLPLFFRWGLPPLANPPDLLILATELAGVGGVDLPLEVSGTDSNAVVADGPVRRLSIVGEVTLSLAEVFSGGQPLCDVLDRSHDVSDFLLEQGETWGWERV